ncbi:glycosyltransferase [Lipingzhangella rawalii]|uniref:glycosyltransferase n=1 Tax=Lipingzhangella rawalii TaxID=2055835 RepID=UPI003898E7E4
MGGLTTVVLALSLAGGLFTQWIQFALGLAGSTVPAALFLWLVFGVNLTVWFLIGLVRAGDDGARSLARRRRIAAARQPSAVTGASRIRQRAVPATGAERTSGAPRVPTPTLGYARGSAPGGTGGDDVHTPSTALALARAAGDVGLGHSPAVDDTRAAPADTRAERRTPAAAGPDEADAAPARIAVVIPAHNEEPVIGAAVRSALRLFHRWDIYVVSDSSRDATADIAADTGVNVLELLTNRGKAGALEAVISEFDLVNNYDAVVILDADTELDEHYLQGVRRQMEDPRVAAVAGLVVAEWKPWERTLLGRLISAYRDRLYVMLQYLMRFGQTWRHTSTTFIVPGFASAYRTRVLREVDINPKGLVIEDFNMTFEVHRRRLGRISMAPNARAVCQDPFTLGDYVRQVRRWTLGFWQTVRLHGIWPSLFWFALLCYLVEVMFVSVVLLSAAALAVFTALPLVVGDVVLEVGAYASVYESVTAVLPLPVLLVGLLVPDYVLTCVLAALRRRPSYLIYGLFFLPLRLIDSYLILRTLPQAWRARSDGRWNSPGRKAARL